MFVLKLENNIVTGVENKKVIPDGYIVCPAELEKVIDLGWVKSTDGSFSAPSGESK
jgi:hypothetical protein